jgi:hypothetical protein
MPSKSRVPLSREDLNCWTNLTADLNVDNATQLQ